MQSVASDPEVPDISQLTSNADEAPSRNASSQAQDPNVQRLAALLAKLDQRDRETLLQLAERLARRGHEPEREDSP